MGAPRVKIVGAKHPHRGEYGRFTATAHHRAPDVADTHRADGQGDSGFGAPEVAALAACMDCGLDYEHFPLDVVLPDADWRAINPEDGGLLCAACIAARVAALPDTIILYARIVSRDDHDTYSQLKNVPLTDLRAALAPSPAALEALADEVERFAKREVAMSRFTGHQDDTLKRWVARLRTLPPASAPMSDWQLIETAPESVPVCTKIDDARGCRNECH